MSTQDHKGNFCGCFDADECDRRTAEMLALRKSTDYAEALHSKVDELLTAIEAAEQDVGHRPVKDIIGELGSLWTDGVAQGVKSSPEIGTKTSTGESTESPTATDSRPQARGQAGDVDVRVAHQFNPRGVGCAENEQMGHALLREWLDAELDPEDEEYGPWMESFTTRVEAALAKNPNPPNGGMETALLEDIDRMREKIHVLGEALKHQRTALMIVRDRQGGRASDKDIDQGIKQIDAALSYIPPEPASGVLAVGNPGEWEIRAPMVMLNGEPAELVIRSNERALINLSGGKLYRTLWPFEDRVVRAALAAADARLSQGIVQPLTFKVASPVEFAMAVRDGKRFEGRDGDVTVVGYLWRGVVYINGTTEVSDAEAIKEFKDRFPPPPNPRAPMMKESDRG